MSEDEHRRQIARAYQVALSRLRQKHDAEFHEILAEVYEEEGIAVRKRASRAEVQRRKVEAARQVLEDHNKKLHEARVFLQQAGESA